MRIYRNVQTGAKSQLGGEKEGLFSIAYHEGMAETAKAEPIPPAERHKKMHVRARINMMFSPGFE